MTDAPYPPHMARGRYRRILYDANTSDGTMSWHACSYLASKTYPRIAAMLVAEHGEQRGTILLGRIDVIHDEPEATILFRQACQNRHATRLQRIALQRLATNQTGGEP